MIYENGSNAKIEDLKRRAGISGDVYLVNDHLMESLESHKRLFPESTAKTIVEAQNERLAYEEEQARIREEQAVQAEAERLAAQQEQEAEIVEAEEEEEDPEE